MSFDTPLFLSVFLPVVVLLHAAVKKNGIRNWILIAAGLVFYAFGSLSGMAVMLAGAVFNFLLCRLLANSPRKSVLVVGIVCDLALLVAFKYLRFIAGELLGLDETAFAAGSIAAPLGISFFVFKNISCLIDTYRDPGHGPRSFSDHLLYVSFFPQAMAGPITRFPEFAPFIESRSVTAPGIASGLRRFILGLGKKLLLVSVVSGVTDAIFALDGSRLSVGAAWLGAVSYLLQIYIDFSSYSDMAIGLGTAFGFETPENFNSPYMASSITDFWRRWHISLSRWFKDYLYIPLGGNRRGKLRAALNKFIVFTLCGLWHGGAWTYIIWGAWHGLLSALETMQIIPTKRLSGNAPGRVLMRVYTLAAVCIGFVVFRAPDLSGAVTMLGAMFGAAGAAPVGFMQMTVGAEQICALLLCVVFCFPLERLFSKLEEKCSAVTPVSYVLALCLLVCCLCASAALGFRPFIYAQF